MEDEIPYYEQYKKLKKEIKVWCEFSGSTIAEKAMGAVDKKQWITSRLHDLKWEKIQKVRLKNKLQKVAISEMEKKSPVNLNKATLEIATLPKMMEINEQLEDLDILIKYLEDTDKECVIKYGKKEETDKEKEMRERNQK